MKRLVAFAASLLGPAPHRRDRPRPPRAMEIDEPARPLPRRAAAAPGARSTAGEADRPRPL